VGKSAIDRNQFSWKAGEICPPSLCCYIGLGVVFDPRSHTRYPPYELMSRNWYVCFCWTWYQEKSKTIPVPGGRFYLHFELSPSYAQESSQELRESPAILVLIVSKIQHTEIGSVPVVLSVAFLEFCGERGNWRSLDKGQGVKKSRRAAFKLDWLF
jgi:hypothetical protein